MAIQFASEHTPASPVSSYCTEADALTFLKGVARDDDRGTLRSLWQSTEISELISFYLPVVKSDIDADTRVDFDYHEDVDIAVDGDGGEWLDLGQFGFRPLLEITALSIVGSVEDVDGWVVYRDGRIARAYASGEGSVIPVPWTRPFPHGRQNIEATITWGYEEADIPPDIKLACALKVGARLLSIADEVPDQNDPGTIGGVQSVQFGDVRFNMGSGGRYSRLVKRMDAQYKQIVNRYRLVIATAPDPNRTSAPGIARRRHYLGLY